MDDRNQRHFRRISLHLPARLTVNAMEEYDGKLINISPGGLAVQCAASVVIGDAVSAAITDLDVIDGTVARLLPDGFALSYRLSKKRRTALTEQIMIRTNPAYADGLQDRRRSLRHRVAKTRTSCRLPDGASMIVTILDRSVDGVAVEASRRPPVGVEITIGQKQGVVLRHTPRGFVIVFSRAERASNRILHVV